MSHLLSGFLLGTIPIPSGRAEEITFDFDSSLITFTPNMDKRVAPGPFATAPIVQGKFDGGSASDNLTFEDGTQISGNFF